MLDGNMLLLTAVALGVAGGCALLVFKQKKQVENKPVLVVYKQRVIRYDNVQNNEQLRIRTNFLCLILFIGAF